MRTVLVRRLERLGHVVLQAADGREALDILGTQPVDVVLTDLRMPEKGGFELLEEIKGDPVPQEIPAIMVSGADDSKEVIRAIELGAEDFLPKPFDPTLLRARVGASVEKKRLRDHQRALIHRLEMQTQALADLNAELEIQVAKQVEEISRLSRLDRFLPPQIAESSSPGARKGGACWKATGVKWPCSSVTCGDSLPSPRSPSPRTSWVSCGNSTTRSESSSWPTEPRWRTSPATG